jgi:hypothetical protein
LGITDVIIRLAALGATALHLIASRLPEASAWSVWPYANLPPAVAWLGAVAVAALALAPINDALRRLLGRLWDALPGRSHPQRWYVVLALSSAVPFWLLRIQHLRWGDAAFIVKALSYTGADRPTWTFYNWQSPLTIFLHARLWLLLNPVPGVGVDTLYALTSVLSGVGFVYVLLCLADQLGRDRLEKATVFGLVVTTGSMQLFFGYIENYTIMSVGVMLSLYLALRCQRGETSVAWPSLALAATNAFHPSTIVLWPAMLCLAWQVARDRARSGDRSGLVWVQLVIPPLLVFVLLAAFMTAGGHGPGSLFSDDRPGGADGFPFVPLFQTTTEWQHYTMFSPAHWLDWANEHFLISPFGLLLLLWALVEAVTRRAGANLGCQTTEGDRGITRFLVVASLCYLVLTFVWNPDYGGRNDWDLFAPSAFVYTLLAAYLFVRGAPVVERTQPPAVARASQVLRPKVALGRNATLLIAAAALHTAAWVIYNASPWRG